MILGKIIYNIKHENFIDVSLIDKLFNMFEDLIKTIDVNCVNKITGDLEDKKQQIIHLNKQILSLKNFIDVTF